MSPAEQSALEGLFGQPFTPSQVSALSACFGHEMRDDLQITALMSGWRTRVVSTMVGEGKVSIAIGSPDGSVAMRAMRLMAEAPLPEGATAPQIAEKAVIEEAWRHLQAGTLDIGHPDVRARLDALVGVLPITQAQADAVKALAVQDHPFALREVSWALNAAMGIAQE